MQFPDGRPLSASHARVAPHADGFTLVELMITVVVLGVVLAIAAPSFSGMINRNRVVASANEVVAALQTARMEAVKRNSRAMLCPSTDGATCSGTDWSRLIVFNDANGDGDPGDAGEQVLRDVAIEGGNLQIKASANVATNQRIGFGADGLARVGNAGAREGGISVCSTQLPAATNTRDVVVAVSRIGVTAERNGTDACTAMTDE